MPTASATTASLRYGSMIEAKTETAESPIKKASQMVLTMGSTSSLYNDLRSASIAANSAAHAKNIAK